MEAVCVLLDIKPARIPGPTGQKIDDYWEPSKKALGDPNFVSSLKTYDKDNIPPRLIESIRKTYTSNPDFTPQNAAKASSAAEGLCKWVCAMERYEDVAKVVKPKQAALAEAQGKYKEVMDALTIKQVWPLNIYWMVQCAHRLSGFSVEMKSWLAKLRNAAISSRAACDAMLGGWQHSKVNSDFRQNSRR
jgi:hypothetical protein